MGVLSEDQIKELKELPLKRLCESESMKDHTTFRAGGPAEMYIEAPRAGFLAVLKFARERAIPYLILGNGSNLLVSDNGIDGIVLSTAAMSSVHTDIDAGIITAESGALLSKVANSACEAGLSGLEFAAGIPGTVGGAVFMNAGAYGGEIADCLIEAECVDIDGNILRISRDGLDMAYRHSAIGDRGLIVLSASFGLKPDSTEAIRRRMQDFSARRAEKQPLDYPSAGSAFKRPDGYFAAALIEEAELKGYSVGAAEVSEKHSGFIINKGGATAADIRRVFSDVSDRVYERSGVRLEPEVRFVGEF